MTGPLKKNNPSVSNAVDAVQVELTVVIGKAVMPIHQLLKMGRGAVIELNAHQDDPCWIFANNRLIALGEIQVQGEKISVAIQETVRAHEHFG